MSIDSLAYVLHKRPYQNTGYIVTFLTAEHGRIDAVAQGAQRISKGKRRFTLDAFQELNVQCAGQGDLLSLRHSESASHPMLFTGKPLFCALYLNELLSYLLPRQEEALTIYHLYQNTLGQLYACGYEALDYELKTTAQEWVLRQFELYLLDELGYAIEFMDALTGDALLDEQTYLYQTGSGFMASNHSTMAMMGSDLNQIMALKNGGQLSQLGDFSHLSESARLTAKTLLRTVLSSILGGKQIKARELFV